MTYVSHDILQTSENKAESSKVLFEGIFEFQNLPCCFQRRRTSKPTVLISTYVSVSAPRAAQRPLRPQTTRAMDMVQEAWLRRGIYVSATIVDRYIYIYMYIERERDR